MLQYKGNVAPPDSPENVKGLWEVYEKDGVSTYQEHTLKTVWTSCEPDKHYFEVTNSPQREAACKKCGLITHFILGIDKLIDGKFSKT